MNTTKTLALFLTVVIALPVSRTFAAGHAMHAMLGAGVIADSAKSKAAADRQEAESLLSRARQAIKDGNLETADSLITRAEKLKVEFGLFHIGDTPKKLRADLSAAQKSTKKPAVAKPSQKFSPDASADKHTATASADSVKPSSPPRVPREVSSPDDDAPLVLPQAAERLKTPAPMTAAAQTPDNERMAAPRTPEPTREQPITLAPSSDMRRQSDVALLTARRALAEGDVRRATSAVEAAKQFGITYGPQEDSPERVEAAIRNYRQVSATASGPEASETARRQLADLLSDQAVQLMRWQDFDEAERLVRHVQSMQVHYGPFDVRPEALLEKIAAARRATGAPPSNLAAPRGTEPPAARTAAAQSTATDASRYAASQAVYEPQRDTTQNRPTGAAVRRAVAQDDDLTELPPSESIPLPRQDTRPGPAGSRGAMYFYQQGEQALRDQNLAAAMDFFRRAYAGREELDPQTLQRLQDHLQLLQSSTGGGNARTSDKPQTLLDNAAAAQQLQLRQLLQEVQEKQLAAGKLREKDPKRALIVLKEARAHIEESSVDADSRARLLYRVDNSIKDIDKYISENRAQIELDEANREVLREVDRRLQNRVDTDDKLAKLIDDYNRLMGEERYAEAEVMAKRARELDPENPVVRQLLEQNKLVSRINRNQSLRDAKERGIWEALNSVEESAIPGDDNVPYAFGNAREWSELTRTRQQRLAEQRTRRTDRELEIEKKLKTPVSAQFRNTPLSEVIDQLSKLAAVNIHLDSKGLDEEGVSSETPIYLNLRTEISLKSALKLILEPLHLSYVIKDEVLKITSEQLKDGEVYEWTYPVADLVIPIPNFTPNGRMGLPGALAEGYSMTGGSPMNGGGPYFANNDGIMGGAGNADVLAQPMMVPGGLGPRAGVPQNIPFGPGGAGQGAQPDFDTLIDLITSTIKPSTWDEVGGPGSISPFKNNLSLVITQTQEVHDLIADLLEQLRRNQDLQVTIEVRFITLNDNFFERIGVDFQANIINPNATVPVDANGNLLAGNLREIVGLNTVGGNAPNGDNPNFAQNLAIPFRQSSFNLATPQFGQPVEVAHFGFAILSDLEAFLLVNAAQGDRRSNVLQAPKVTLFNGQQASVQDTTQSPFVVSVTPVVGDFAAAYQPVIAVLSEGTFLSVQAVVSNDHRFVRLTVIPLFSQIGDVQEFTFSGSKQTTKNTEGSTSKGGPLGDSSSSSNDETTTTEGVTIQLPNFSVVSVTTTVSVPDGGTVLLGGIKRLSEGRNEFGVPILSKLPYINRLFKNVGIGRETQSLMMMVTPRIIIQEEEELRLGLQNP